MEILDQISLNIQNGNPKRARDLVIQALEENIDAELLLNGALISAMSEVGSKFRKHEIFVPEMLMASRAMNACLQILEPILTKTGVKPIGKAVIGTVKDDLHDIGKNLVRMMMKGAGIEVYDLGVNVDASEFVNKAEEVGAKIICMSALLTTTMPAMKGVIAELEKRGVREKYTVIIGGAPVNSYFAKEIGADRYASDAASAAQIAKEILTGFQMQSE